MMPRVAHIIQFDQVDEKCSHIRYIVLQLETLVVYEVTRENLAHLPL